MKRSAAITLLALGAGAVAIQSQLGNTDSESPRDDGSVFTSKEQCASAGSVAKVDCEKGWSEAQKDHAASAPHYGTMADCEKVYGAGKCVTPTTTTGSAASYVIPAMMGYMIGRSWSSAGCRAAPLYRRPTDPKDQYLFTAGTCSAYRTSGGSSGGRGYGGGGGYRSSTYARSTTTRGGFGSTGRGFSGRGGA